MFRAKAWTGGFAGLIAVAILLAPSAIGHAGGTDEAQRLASMTQIWLDDRVDKLEQQTALTGDDETKPASPAEQAADPGTGDPEQPTKPETVSAWVDAQIAETEATASARVAEATELAKELNRDAEHQISVTHTFLASVTGLGDDDEAESMQTDGGVAEAAPRMSTAAMVASVAVAATAGSLFVMFWTAGSTAGTASGAAAGAKSGSAGLKKVAPVFSPLFTRFEGREVLKHPNRAQLYTLIAANPGVRLQDLCVETTLSRTAVTHHVRLLEQQHLIVSERVGRSRHYYENGGRYERQKKDAYAVLQNDRSKDIARYILSNPGTIQKALCDSLDLRASIAHWHIKRLQEAALVDCVREGRTVSYFPAGNLNGISL